MTIKIHDPHDRLFRNFLADINKAKDFLETYLPENIKKHCDFSALTFKPGSFVEKDLKHHFSDILLSQNCRNTRVYLHPIGGRLFLQYLYPQSYRPPLPKKMLKFLDKVKIQKNFAGLQNKYAIRG